jgi:hypothetical protein
MAWDVGAKHSFVASPGPDGNARADAAVVLPCCKMPPRDGGDGVRSPHGVVPGLGPGIHVLHRPFQGPLGLRGKLVGRLWPLAASKDVMARPSLAYF